MIRALKDTATVMVPLRDEIQEQYSGDTKSDDRMTPKAEIGGRGNSHSATTWRDRSAKIG
jgi:hypothetical protein